MRRVMVAAVVVLAVAAGPASAQKRPVQLPAHVLPVRAAVQVTIEEDGIAHVKAGNPHDLYLVAGWIHAQDRLFQMDTNRRLASGTLAELLGPAALGSDVQLRTIGLRRAAERSLAALAPETRAALAAYADGVNAFASTMPLPPEYRALELTKFEPWTPVDSVVIGKLIAFGLSFDLDVQPTIEFMSYVKAGQALGFDGTALYFADLDRSAPFDPAATVPDATTGFAPKRALAMSPAAPAAAVAPPALDLARRYLDQVKDIPVFAGMIDRSRRQGSNEWAVSGAHTTSGYPLLANDPHLQLGMPSTFYPLGLEGPGSDAFGSTFAGVPFIVQGYNREIAWGTTNNAIDVTDTFQEQVVPDPTSPSGLATVYLDTLEPIIPVPEVFRANTPGDGVPDDLVVVPPGGPIPPVTLIVPRRDNGPIVQLDMETGVALSVQYTGFSATRELDCFALINRAKNLDDFTAALQFMDFGSQNFVYGDKKGTIAYFTTGEMPVREDLQAMTVNGLPPWFIRNGTGGNEWLPVEHTQPQQAVPHEVLPFSEMPQIVNPPAGWFVNANNDPAGITLDNDPLNQVRPEGGLYYLAYRWNAGFRAGRITERIREALAGGGTIDFATMQSIQADTKERDAQAFVPWITRAWADATAPDAAPELAALAADPRLVEAAQRIAVWDFSTPTGIPPGYDAADVDGQLLPPTPMEIETSIAATLYATWRGRFIANVIDARLVPYGLPVPDGGSSLAALKNLLDTWDATHGVGASGIDFFAVPGIASPDVARDVLILKSLRDALDELAGPAFAPAFGGSTNQIEYEWGKLHRIVFAHVLDGPFSVPPAGGMFPPPLPNLPGIPVDGGYETVDAASYNVRAASVNGFMFDAGPVRRFVGEVTPHGPVSQCVWPGGTSGVLGSPYYLTFLPLWLTNDYVPTFLGNEVRPHAAFVILLTPSRDAGDRPGRGDGNRNGNGSGNGTVNPPPPPPADDPAPPDNRDTRRERPRKGER